MLILEFLTQILVLGVRPLEMGTRPTDKKLPTWGVSSRPTMIGVPMHLQGTSTTSQLNMQQIIAFLYTNQQTFIIHARVHLGQGNLRL